MPTLTTEQQLIVGTLGDEVTDAAPGGILAANIATIWNLHASAPSAEVQFLRTKRDAIDMLLGVERKKVSFEANGASVEMSDRAKALLEMRDGVVGDLKTALGAAAVVAAATGVSQATVVGLIATRTPTTPLGWADGNDPTLRGSVYRRRR